MKRFFAGFFTCACLMACATSPLFSYRFYNITGNPYTGTLLGPDASKDIPFSRCAPVNGVQQCVVVFYTELNALIKDYKQTKVDLIACQKGN